MVKLNLLQQSQFMAACPEIFIPVAGNMGGSPVRRNVRLRAARFANTAPGLVRGLEECCPAAVAQKICEWSQATALCTLSLTTRCNVLDGHAAPPVAPHCAGPAPALNALHMSQRTSWQYLTSVASVGPSPNWPGREDYGVPVG